MSKMRHLKKFAVNEAKGNADAEYFYITKKFDGEDNILSKDEVIILKNGKYADAW